MASTYLTRTPGTTGSQATGTYAFWVKRGAWSAFHTIFSSTLDTSNYFQIDFTDADAFQVSAKDGGSYILQKVTTRRFVDTAAWYHVTVTIDTTEGAAEDRCKIYFNGVKETSFSTNTNLGTENVKMANSTYEQIIGRNNASSGFLDGALCHYHFIDGTAYDPTAFGAVDATSGIFCGESSPSVTYGTQGQFMKFESGSFGTASSGNGNNMTVGAGTMTRTKDNPDNNFLVLNPLDNFYPQYTFGYGNTRLNKTVAGPETFITHSVPLYTGKWYWETKITEDGSNMNMQLGVADRVPQGPSGAGYEAGQYLGFRQYTYGYYGADGAIYDGNGASSSAYGNSYAEGDVIGTYLDLDNSKLYFAINGTIQNSGTGISIQAVANTQNGFYLAATGTNSGATETKTWDHNFGNGYFGETIIADAVADAGGEGLFKYNPSTGTFDGSSKDFRAVCTVNIATYG